jgi:pimeloyl-ACP methyl ester carboxylesterase
MASFHWPFLANVEVATALIKAQGGDIWTRTCINRWLGKSEAGLAKFNENNAFDVYCEFMKDESVIRATCDDYRAGAEEDIQLQEEDQKEGRKIDIDALAIYSSHYFGSKYDIGKEWEDWVGKGKLEALGIGDGAGHFVAEEAPEKTAAAIVDFYRKHA